MRNQESIQSFRLPAIALLVATVVPPIVPNPAPVPVPPPEIRIVDPRANEQPVAVATSSETLEQNALARRVRVSFVFTNPNQRVMSADVEFPLPDRATVCGYALEINGVMVPGAIVEKERARVAFESEKAKGVDPGLVEQVKGNLWKTRIFPLTPNVPRRAWVEYVEPVAEGDAAVVYERDGDEIFAGERLAGGEAVPAADPVAEFSSGVILWDASASAEASAAKWRASLDALPAEGDWELVVFRNECESAKFTSKAGLIAAVEKIVYDGGTDIARAVAAAADRPTLMFSDENDTLGLAAPRYENLANVRIASRPAAPARPVRVRKLADGETPPEGAEVKEAKLLATLWAADRVQDLASQAESRKEEFLALGRRYGVASPVTSLIVLEDLQQYIDHKIEPHPGLSFHDEWVRRTRAEDDEIAAAKLVAEHESELLRLWDERISWWNDPIPPRRTPKSGLFDGDERAVASEPVVRDGASAGGALRRSRNARRAEEPEMDGAGFGGEPPPMVACAVEMEEMEVAAEPQPNSSQAGGGGATITIKPWDSGAPYLKSLEGAADPYAAYLAEKKTHGASPAFYIDVAGWFFKKGENRLARRIISNMAEFKLEDAAVWRSMGWRLREAGEYEAAIVCFRQALRLRNEEGQARRDLAIVLSEYGQQEAATRKAALEEAMELLREAAFTPFARRSARRSNDRQIAIIALEELNALISWCEANGAGAKTPELKPAFRRNLPVKVRIALAWDADETDIDIHVLEPEGEEAFYGHRRTSAGGFVGEDVTTGYGPEEYMRKEGTGKFRILAHYYASHQTDLTGAVTASATVYTDWGTAAEKREVITMRLDKPHSKHLLGEVEIAE